jgi:aminoglycoside 2'-N-acetyltransferase I
VRTADLSEAEIRAIRRLLWAAFPPGDDGITEDDWQHALGGVHFLVELDGEIVAHAAIVERALEVAGQPLRTGYVEAVATKPSRQGRGLGTLVMLDFASHLDGAFELGALGTGSHHFYERLGWRTWRGPTSVRTKDGPRPTPGEDGYILVLTTAASPALDLESPISCDWRPGDAW